MTISAYSINNNLESIKSNINDYIDKIMKSFENDIHNFINNNNLYKICRDVDVLRTIIINSLSTLIIDLNNTIINQLTNDFNINEFTPSIDINKVCAFNWNASLMNQYKCNFFISSQLEKHIDDILDIDIYHNSTNKMINKLKDKIRLGNKFLGFFRLSKENFYYNHKENILNRISGIILNIKSRIKLEYEFEINQYIKNKDLINIRKNVA